MKYISNVKQRIAEVKMLHIGLGDGWRLIDIVFVITGRIL